MFNKWCLNTFFSSACRVYSFPVFTRKFCDDFLAEVLNFEKSDAPKGRPNTMNRYGVCSFDLIVLFQLSEQTINSNGEWKKM